MSGIVNIIHPLLNHPGRSQGERLPAALDPSKIKIDGRSTADMLDFIYRFSRQINYFNDQLEISSDWRPFFEKSTPFQLARLHKLNIQQLEDDFDAFAELVQVQPVKENIRLLFDYVYTEIVVPTDRWMARFNEEEFGFGLAVNKLVAGNLQGTIKEYIALFNAANHWYCIGRRSFFPLLEQDSWGLDMPDLFIRNDEFRATPGGSEARIGAMIEQLDRQFRQLIGVLKVLSSRAPDFLEESLMPLREQYRKRHQPQLGLLFAFLRLFELFQGELNKLSEEHLKFFFLQVLNIQQRPESPDQAHLIFEAQKEVEDHFLPAGTLFLDGKDPDGNDLIYQLTREILIDKAQVQRLRTFHLAQRPGNPWGLGTREYIRSLHIASDATMADGVDKKFPKEGPRSWPALGGRLSKFIEPAVPPSLEPKPYPFARVGLVLASPVLLLNEGHREIQFNLQCRLEPPECEGEGVEEDFEFFFNPSETPVWEPEDWYEIDVNTFEELINSDKDIPNATGDILSGYEALIFGLEDLIRNTDSGIDFKTGEDVVNILIDALYEDETGETETLFPPFEYEIGVDEQRRDFWPQVQNIFQSLTKGCKETFKYRVDGAYGLREMLYNAMRRILRMDTIEFLLSWDREEFGGTDGDRTLAAAAIMEFVEQQFISPIESSGSGRLLTYFRLSDTSTLREHCASIFSLAFSGEEIWVEPKEENMTVYFRPFRDTGTDHCLEVMIEVELESDEPAVTFFNGEALQENFTTHLPLARLLLNPECRIELPAASVSGDSSCSLEYCPEDQELMVSPYQFLRYLVVEDACIEVKVCGLRNLVVQNDENLQDVNAPIYPFGVRPTVEEELNISSSGDPDLRGSNFFIGSKEVFYKNWENVWVNFNWKDKPASLKDHYFGYQDVSQGIPQPKDEDFMMQVSVLENQQWIKEVQGAGNPYTVPAFSDAGTPIPSKHLRFRPVFETSRNFVSHCIPHHSNLFDQYVQIEHDNFNRHPHPRQKTLDQTPLIELDVNTRKGFLRFTLKNTDFQHSRYPFVLARQMMAFGKFPKDFVFGAVYSFIDSETGEQEAITRLDEWDLKIKRKEISLFTTFQQIDRVCEFALKGNTHSTTIVGAIKAAIDFGLRAKLRQKLIDDLTLLISNSKNEPDYATIVQEIIDSTAFTNLIGNSITNNTVHGEIAELITTVAAGNTLTGTASEIIIQIVLDNLRHNLSSSTFNHIVLRSQLITGITEAITDYINNLDVDALLSAGFGGSIDVPEDIENLIKANLLTQIPEAPADNAIPAKAEEIITDVTTNFINNEASLVALVSAQLQTFLNNVKNSTSTAGLVSTTTTTIQGLIETFLRNTVRDKIEEVVDEVLGDIADEAAITTTIDNVYLHFDLTNVEIMKIDESIEVAACGAIDSTTCDINESRFDNIFDAAEFEQSLFAVDAAEFGLTVKDLVKLRVRQYCARLKAIRNATNTSLESALEEFAAFIDSIDDLTELNAEPVKLRELLKFFGLGDLNFGLAKFVEFKKSQNQKLKESTVVIPNEPYTPIIKDLSLDYTATAVKDEIVLIHLYPFDNTFRKEAWEWEDEKGKTHQATLLPTHEEEGTLFIGIAGLVPGNTLNLLFQLAEATADSEVNKAVLNWYYLRGSEWVVLQDLFHILEDHTNSLTRSGIVQIAIPGDIKQPEGDSLMPPGHHWLKICADRNTAALSEIINVHTQAAVVKYEAAPENRRANMKIAAGSIAKPADADPIVKKVEQPYDSFGGREAEVSNRYFTRVSEQLRHKGRAVTLSDYEQLVLDRFPEIFRVKCANHTFGLPGRQYRRDLEVAPGFVCVVVIPDLDQLQVGDRLAPRAPVSLLDDIKAFLKKKMSPFIRLKVMNPRFEEVEVTIAVQLYRDRTSTEFYRNKLQEDIRNFLAPWNVGQYHTLRFGQGVSRSSLIRLVENLDYVDYICSLSFNHKDELDENCLAPESGAPQPEIIMPKTARSILTAGDITVDFGDKPCESYDPDPELGAADNCKEEAAGEQDLFPVGCED